MPFVLLIVGAILVVAAFNNSHGDLGKALQSDLPGFFKWGAAIAAILGLGFVPGFKTPSRWLLALVLLVIVLKNYSAIFAGLTSFAKTGPAATNAGPDVPTPSAAFSASAGQSTTPAPASDVTGSPSSPSSTPTTLLDFGTAGNVTWQSPAWLTGALGGIEKAFGLGGG